MCGRGKESGIYMYVRRSLLCSGWATSYLTVHMTSCMYVCRNTKCMDETHETHVLYSPSTANVRNDEMPAFSRPLFVHRHNVQCVQCTIIMSNIISSPTLRPISS